MTSIIPLCVGPRDAAAQSAAFILGGALGSAWVNITRAHPEDGEQPLIDFDMLLFLSPLMLAGVGLGERHTVLCCAVLCCAVLCSAQAALRGSCCVQPGSAWRRAAVPGGMHPFATEWKRACSAQIWTRMAPPLHARAAGVLLNRIFPNWLVVFTLLVAMVWQIQLMLRKGLALRRGEQEARRAAQAAAEAAGALGKTEKPGEGASTGTGNGSSSAAPDPAPSWAARGWAAVKEELFQAPRLGPRALTLLAAVAIIWAGFVAFQVWSPAPLGSRRPQSMPWPPGRAP